MPDALHVYLRDQGTILASRRRGRFAADHLRGLADDPADLILDFVDVEAATPPFLMEVLDAVHAIISRDPDQGRLVVVANLNDDLAETIGLVLERRKETLAYRRGNQVELLKSAPHLAQTLREAQSLKRFTVNELAERLEIKPTAVHQRLQPLLASGAVARDLQGDEQDQRAHVFRAVNKDIPALRASGRSPRRLAVS
jgi:hypothetical protein